MVKKEVHPEIGNRIRMLRERKGIDQLQLVRN